MFEVYVIFSNLRMLSFVLRYRENSHGILTFRYLQLSPVFGVARTNYFYFGRKLEYFK